jgi:hypothetical protein
MPTYDYGVKGGYWGTGENLQDWIKKPMTRLLSPEEFRRLDNSVISAYGGYMGYLNTFAKLKKAKTQEADAYTQVKGGTYEPFDMNVSYDKSATTSTRGRMIPTAAESAKGARIPTTIRRDLSGMPTEELAGGGVRRSMGGEVIPQTGEQYGAVKRIDRAIPVAEMEADTDFLTTVGNLKTAQSNVELNKRAEAARKLALSEKKVDIQGKQFTSKQKQQVDLQDKRLAHQEKLINLRQDWQTGQEELDRELVLSRLKIIGEQSVAKQKQALADHIKLLDIAESKNISAETRAAIVQEKKDLQDWKETNDKLVDQIMVKSLTANPEQQAAMARAGVNVKSRTYSQDVGRGRTGERFNTIQEAKDAGHESGDTVMMWDSYNNKFRLGVLP